MGNEPFRVAYIELELASGSEISWLELYELSKISEFYLSPVEPPKKLMGLAEIWARVVLGIGLFYYEVFFRPGPLSRVRYPFQL